VSHTLILPDQVYSRLTEIAAERGLTSVEQLLTTFTATESACQRSAAVRRVDELRTELAGRYGQMPDSVDLIREDRAR
jgi:hypothetical protein